MALLKVWMFIAATLVTSSRAASKLDTDDELLDADLPEVDSLMEEAQDHLDDFKMQAETMKQQVADNEKVKRDALERMKATYDANLTEQASTSEQIVQDSKHLMSLVDRENDKISQMRLSSSKAQKSNDIMRQALNSLQSKMGVAANFLVDSLKASDVSNATELTVLRPTTPEPSLQNFLQALDDGRSHKAVSLLGVSSKKMLKADSTRKQTPEVLVDTLSQRLSDLGRAGEQGEAQLEARFLALHELGAKKQAELLAHKQSLEQELKSKQALHKELTGAYSHLLQMRGDLRQRVKGIQSFAQKGGEVASVALEHATNVYNNTMNGK